MQLFVKIIIKLRLSTTHGAMQLILSNLKGQTHLDSAIRFINRIRHQVVYATTYRFQTSNVMGAQYPDNVFFFQDAFGMHGHKFWQGNERFLSPNLDVFIIRLFKQIFKSQLPRNMINIKVVYNQITTMVRYRLGLTEMDFNIGRRQSLPKHKRKCYFCTDIQIMNCFMSLFSSDKDANLNRPCICTSK